MDFTPELTAFQGVLISINKTQPFSGLAYRGNNEDHIKFVVDSLLGFLQKENYINENTFNTDKEDQMRKFALFLILNTDLSVLDKMVDMEGLNSVIWILPTIPKCLLSEILWELHMKQFIYEILSFSTPQLALEVAQALIENIKYFSPTKCIEKLKIICAACYRQLCRIHMYNLDNDTVSNITMSLCHSFNECLKYYNSPPNAHKIVNLSKDEQYKLKGNYLYNIFSLIYDCLEEYSGKQDFTSNDFKEIYLLTFMIDELATDTSKQYIRTASILETLDKCHQVLLDTCKDMVMDINVEIFCAWSEFEENDNSMQQMVGELCYKLRENLLNNVSLCEHPLVSMMEQISAKPVCVQDIVNSSDISTILENISESSNKAEWIRALIHRDKLCHDITLIEHLSSKLDLLQSDECHTLFNICQNYLKSNSDNSAIITSLAVKLFNKCTNEIKCEILENRFKDRFFDMEEIQEFNNAMTEIFNKLIATPDADLYDVLNVFIQNPQKVYTKILLLATENSQQTDIMLKVIKLLEKYSNLCYSHETEPCIIGTINKVVETLDRDVKQKNFINYLCSLKSCNIITGPKLLLLIVMPHLHKALVNHNISAINIQCQLLSEAFTMLELEQYRAPMLAMLAQIMETVRWKFDTYTPVSSNTLHLVLELQQTLCASYTDGIPDKDKNWLKSKLNYLHPVNLYYFNKLWNTSKDSFLEQVLSMSIGEDTDITELSAGMALILSSSTQKEWCVIWENLSVYGDDITIELFSNVLVHVTKSETPNRTPTTYGCLMNSYRNFVYIIRYNFFKEPLSDSQVLKVINKIASLVNLHQDDSMEDLATILVPLFGYIMERRNDYSINITSELGRTISHSKIRETICKLFSNGTA